MASDEDLIISIPDDEPEEEIQDAEFKIIDEDEDTPVSEIPGEPSKPVNKAPDGPPSQSWSAIKLYHPLLGAGNTPEDVPEAHKFAIAANMMLGPVGAPLREGGSNIFITGVTPEDVAQEFYNTIVSVFKEMQEQMSPIVKPNPGDMAALKAEMEARNRGR